MENNLEMQLGLSLQRRPQFTRLVVDNGDNRKGLNTTGEFVEKSKDEAGNFVRVTHGKNLEGIVLASRARLMRKYDPNKENPWWTPEFNPLNPNELVKICVGGQVKSETTYKEMKHNPNFVTIDPQTGKSKNNFTYISVLYVLIGSETLKIEFTGRSQGNWIQYSSKMNKAGKSLLKHLTKFRIVENKEDGNFECKMTSGAKVEEEEEIRGKAVELLGVISNTGNLLTTGSTTKESRLVALPGDVEPPVEDEPPADENTFTNSPEEEEIKIENIPF